MVNDGLDENFLVQNRLNETVQKWGIVSRDRYLYHIHTLPFAERRMWKKRKKSAILRGNRTVKVGFKKYFGNIVRVKWNFAQHGIFQEYGVGRGRKKGSGREKPMPWLVKTLDEQVPQLADYIVGDTRELLGTVIKIKVNGLFDMDIR